MAALLTIESQNTDKLAFYLGECREMGVAGAAAGRQRQRPAVHASSPGRRRPLRPRRDQERRRGRDPVDARRSRNAQRPIRPRSIAVRARRPAPRQQARAREPGQGRRARLVPRRRRRLDGAADRRRGARGCSPRSIARSSRAAGARSIASRASRCCSAATPAATTDDAAGAAAGDAVDGRGAAARREGSARPLPERPSAGAHPRRLQASRRAARAATLATVQAAATADGRHRQRLPHRQDAQGRPHGRVHARGPAAAASRSWSTPSRTSSSPSLIENDRMVLVTAASKSTTSGRRSGPPSCQGLKR